MIEGGKLGLEAALELTVKIDDFIHAYTLALTLSLKREGVMRGFMVNHKRLLNSKLDG